MAIFLASLFLGVFLSCFLVVPSNGIPSTDSIVYDIEFVGPGYFVPLTLGLPASDQFKTELTQVDTGSCNIYIADDTNVLISTSVSNQTLISLVYGAGIAAGPIGTAQIGLGDALVDNMEYLIANKTCCDWGEILQALANITVYQVTWLQDLLEDSHSSWQCISRG